MIINRSMIMVSVSKPLLTCANFLLLIYDCTIERFADGEITHIKATELVDLSVWEFARLVEDADAAWVSGDHLEVDPEELWAGSLTLPC